MKHFRLLSGCIGLYREAKENGAFFYVLPSPLEVDRFISDVFTDEQFVEAVLPSPREVDRFISDGDSDHSIKSLTAFPSPREVNRFISNMV